MCLFPAAWVACALTLPAATLPSAPVPPDPHELVTGAVQVPATPAERAAVLSLLERAKQNSDMHMPGTPPFQLKVTFNAAGNTGYTGSGELAETWMNGQNWRWTANLGSYSQSRITSQGQTVDEQKVTAIPLRVGMLRAAIFWPVGGNPSTMAIRSAVVQWNGNPATCILMSRVPAATAQARLWEEEEDCVDSASGLLQIHSVAPGSYTVYQYDEHLQFHGRVMPNRIVAFVDGTQVLEAHVEGIADAPTDAQWTAPAATPANAPPIMLLMPMRFRMEMPSTAASGTVQPVVVHAAIDGSGNVLEAEISAAADASLAQAALDMVKQTRFAPRPGTQRDFYVDVRFEPTAH